MKKSNNKQVKESSNKVVKEYTFPSHNMTIKASSPEEARKKLESLLDEKK